MHQNLREFFLRVKNFWPEVFTAERVIEFGSYDINGNPREYFDRAQEYVGLDWRPGPKVDVVSLAHEYKGHPDGHFNTVISTSMIEHDPHWKQSLRRMVDLTAPGGSILITCGAAGFHEHELETAPPEGGGETEPYYGNRTAGELIAELTKNGERFLNIVAEESPVWHDNLVLLFNKIKDPDVKPPTED